AWDMGDTVDYVRHIRQYGAGDSLALWEFGHLLWRPLGYAVFYLCGALVRRIVGDDPAIGVTFCLVALNWLAGFASELLMTCLSFRASERAWAAHLATVAFILTQTFLNFSQTGCSYIPGLALLLACFYFLSRPESPDGRSTFGWLWAGLALAGSLS